MATGPRERLDVILVERGLVESREQARRLILAGQVLAEDRVLDKPGHRYAVDLNFRVKQRPRYVGRGGEKLQGAFDRFHLDVTGLTCLDAGASTGGFTDCLLQHGAAHVYAVDVGKGQLAWSLRNDSRVTVMEGRNARELIPADFPDVPAFAAVDVSFISLTKILPAVIEVLSGGARLVTLVKPQFEAGRKNVEKGGVVRDPAVHRAVVQSIREFGVEKLGLRCLDECESPLKGPAGNKEYLVYWQALER